MEPAPDSPYCVPTRQVDASIEIDGGRREDVVFYLPTAAPTHEGPEAMDEMLNRRRRFIPVRSRESGELFLVRRLSLVTVTVAQSEGAHALEKETGLPTSIDFVRFEMKHGEVLEGALATVLPPETSRMSDFFNLETVTFLPLLVGENVVHVNKEFIAVVHL